MTPWPPRIGVCSPVNSSPLFLMTIIMSSPRLPAPGRLSTLWPAQWKVYNRAGGAAPPGVAALGPEVWRGDRPPPERGFLALGTPVGDPAFVHAATTARLDAEHGLLAELLQLPDLQSAWLLLTYCAAPRAQHLLRTLPPSMSTEPTMMPSGTRCRAC